MAAKRLPPIPYEQLAPEAKELYERIHGPLQQAFGDAFKWKRESDGAFLGPFNIGMHAPEMGTGMFETVAALRKCPTLPEDASETAILVVAAKNQAAYITYAHRAVVISKGLLTEEQVEAIGRGERPENLNDKAKAAYDLAAYQTSTPGPLPQAEWDKAEKVLGHEATLFLTFQVGFYVFQSLIFNAVDIQVPSEDD